MKAKSIIKEVLKELFYYKRQTFFSLACRPVLASDVNTMSYYPNDEKIGIVIQGGIWEKYDFTFETVKLYNKIYPNAIVILSTWDDTPRTVLDKFSQLRVELIVSKKPVPIVGNANLQIISSRKGIIRARELGCKYVCKTRTDQRMYARDVFPYAIKLIDMFPVKDNFDIKGRIVVLGCNTFRNRLYDVNDMWLFGHIEDVYKYWSCSPNMEWGDDIRDTPPIVETYACTEYLKKIGYTLNWDYNDSINVYATFFIVIDAQSIDLFWVKKATEYINRSYDGARNVEFAFRDWLLLQDAIRK